MDLRDRKPDVPVGLKNTGNSCYSNAIFQSVFFLPHITTKLLNARISNSMEQNRDPNKNQVDLARELASRNMVCEFQKLSTALLYTNQSYGDPTNMINSVINDFGQKVSSGDQEDVSEYWLNLVERLEEGLGEANKDKPVHRFTVLDNPMS